MKYSIWQIACGDNRTNYDKVFLDHDVMLLGPGNPGPYRDETEYPTKNWTRIRAFVKKPKGYDLVLMRRGHEVIHLGIAAYAGDADYVWLEEFADVNGWDLQHTRRVFWDRRNILSKYPDLRNIFRSNKQQPAFSEVHLPAVKRISEEIISNLTEQYHTAHGELNKLPPKPVELDINEFGSLLFSEGLSDSSVNGVMKTIQKARRLQNWYKSNEFLDRPSEHETVAHLILPLLLAVGWSEQQLAIEWKRVDLACFNNPRKLDSIKIICEAKKQGKSLESAYHQAIEYTRKLKLVGCKFILITDGVRLQLFEKAGGWPESPTHYLNLDKLRRDTIGGLHGAEIILKLRA